MGHSSAARQSRVQFLAGILDRVSDTQVETLEILSDVDQMTQMMTSLLEAKTGEIVSFESAFADL